MLEYQYAGFDRSKRPELYASASRPGGSAALQNITFTIQEGELVALVGANGFGQDYPGPASERFARATSGSVRIAGFDTRQKSDYSTIRTSVGMVFQSPEDQIVGMTVEEDVASARKIWHSASRNSATGELRPRNCEYGRGAPAPASPAFSRADAAGGLAGILAMRPRCIIFDEATSCSTPRAAGMSWICCCS